MAICPSLDISNATLAVAAAPSSRTCRRALPVCRRTAHSGSYSRQITSWPARYHPWETATLPPIATTRNATVAIKHDRTVLIVCAHCSGGGGTFTFSTVGRHVCIPAMETIRRAAAPLLYNIILLVFVA
ncbi:unnamed protein product [Macrosiphum euphorbiae]|uniref:Uncharacterized protein n=1 Tax=Macrosiphum euphorbiae TaxID=13131 RepID=A0AAV0VVM4_9HEMI|nr:unnamed protein product [Macrosiphum euphorbiae]